MKPAMILHLTMVVVADASFGRSRFRSEPFLRRFWAGFVHPWRKFLLFSPVSWYFFFNIKITEGDFAVFLYRIF
jgi:hypothetical protein